MKNLHFKEENMRKIIIYFGFIVLFLLLFSLTVTAASAAGTITKLGEQEWKRLVAGMKGKVVFVNVWATWCGPCREEFPDLIKLSDTYKNRDVRFISISADYPDEIESKILPFLEKFKVNFPVFVQDFKDPQDFINLLNPGWNGALPATFIIDAKGVQRSFIVGKRDFEFLKKEIEKFHKL